MDDNIAKNIQNLQSYVPTEQTTDRMTLKFFSETILLLEVDCFVGILNQIKIDEIVNNYLNSCNS